VASYFSPHRGGIESYVQKLSSRLSEGGHEVTILTTDIPPSKREERIGRIEVHRYRAPIKPLGNPLAIGMLEGFLSHRDFDIVHSHDEHAFTTNLSALARRMGKQRLVVSCHGRLVYTAPLGRMILSAYERTLMRSTLGSAEAIIALSESDRHYLSALGVERDRISVIPNAIDPPARTSPTEGGAEGRVILCVGQLLQRKGIEILVEAMQEVHEAHRSAKLLIVGEGERKTELLKMRRQRGLEEAILFKGRASEAELEEAYSSCDLLVLPSFAEGMPTVILEAMARGKPVVATDIPGVREHFSETAILVPPGEPHGLSEAIVRALDDEQLRRRLGLEGRRLVESRFTWDIVVRQIVDLYGRIIGP
jgi:glycosyltransferase involved in cell wall biosynthesis